MQHTKAMLALVALEKMHLESYTGNFIKESRYKFLESLTSKIRKALDNAAKLEQQLVDQSTAAKKAIASMQRTIDQTNAQNDANIDVELAESRERIAALEQILFLSTYATIPAKHQRPELVNAYCKTYQQFNAIAYSSWCVEYDTIDLMAKKGIPLHQQQIIEFTHFKLNKA